VVHRGSVGSHHCGTPLVRGGNAGVGFRDGLPFQPWAAELQKKRAAEQGLNDPDGLCLPPERVNQSKGGIRASSSDPDPRAATMILAYLTTSPRHSLMPPARL
jgi:hypothetical protein